MKRKLGLSTALVGLGMWGAQAAYAQCTPELDGQSGTASARLVVTCTGDTVLWQGDSSNDFVDITVNGTIRSVPFDPPPINIDSNNTVTVNGSLVGQVYGILMGSRNAVTVNGAVAAGGAGIFANSAVNVFITVAAGGQVSGSTHGIRILSAATNATGNSVTMNGTVVASAFDISAAIEISGATAAENNTVTIGGQITTTTAAGVAILSGGGAVRNNTVALASAGTINGGGLTSGVLLSSGAAGASNNTINVAGNSTTFGHGVWIRSAGDTTGNAVNIASTSTVETISGHGVNFLAGGSVSANTINVAGTLNSGTSQYGVNLQGGTGVNSNVINLASTARVQNIQLNGTAVSNTIDNSGAIGCLSVNASCVSPTVLITAGSSNTLINRAGGSINGLVRTTGTTGFTFQNFGSFAGGLELGGSSTLSHFTGASLNADIIGSGNSILALGGTGSGTIGIDRFSGMGSLTVNGGTWTTSGNGSGFLAALIAGGSLNVNGALTAATTIGAAGRLSGTGTVGALTVNGVVAPGNSVGTLNVAGGTTFNAGSTYEVEVAACGATWCADRIAASGTAAINGGTVNLLLPTGFNGAFSSVPILNAASVTGQWTTVTSPNLGPFRQASLTYQPTQVLLNVTTDFSVAAQSDNQASVAGALNAAGASSGAYSALLGLQTLAQGEAAFDSLSGVAHGSVPRASEYAWRQFTSLAMDRLENLQGGGPAQYAQLGGSTMNDASPGRAEGGLRAWASGYGAAGEIGAVISRPRTEYEIGGVALGVEGNADAWTVGAALGFGSTEGDVGPDRFETQSISGQVYAGWTNDALEFRAAGGVGKHDVDSRRAVTIGAVTQAAIGAYSGLTVGATTELGVRMSGGGFRLTPFGGFDYLHSSGDAFTETQSSFGNLVVPETSDDSARASLGLRLRSEDGLADGLVWPSLRVAYARDLLDDPAPFQGAFTVAPPAVFAVEGAAFGKDRLLAGAALDFDLGPNTTFAVGYEGEFARDDSAHMATASFRARF